MAREFEGKVHRLDDLFADEQRRIIGIVLQDRIEDYQRTFERLTSQDDDVLNRLGQLHYPIPKPLRAAASSYLDLHLEPGDSPSSNRTASLARDPGDSTSAAEAWGYQPERDRWSKRSPQALERILRGLDPDADLPAIVAQRASSCSTPPPSWASAPTSGRCRTSCSTPTSSSPTRGDESAAPERLRRPGRQAQHQPEPARLAPLTIDELISLNSFTLWAHVKLPGGADRAPPCQGGSGFVEWTACRVGRGSPGNAFDRLASCPT